MSDSPGAGRSRTGSWVSQPAARPSAFGQLLRRWRRARGWSQLELGLEAQVPQRHVSFLETGRARPGESMVLRLGHALDLPLSERNGMLAAAGFAPAFDTAASASLERGFFQSAVREMLDAHAPYPALALNGWWDVTQRNTPAARLLTEESSNLVDAIFEPGPFRARVLNWAQVARASFARLSREAREHPSDARLQSLAGRAAGRMAEAGIALFEEPGASDAESIAVCPQIRVGPHTVRLLTMVARFASVRDAALEEARVELLFPADAESATRLRSLAGSLP
ncbi:MAG: helix-turn-helix domain-containing protein [Sandaracinaceae bacterium]